MAEKDPKKKSERLPLPESAWELAMDPRDVSTPEDDPVWFLAITPREIALGCFDSDKSQQQRQVAEAALRALLPKATQDQPPQE